MLWEYAQREEKIHFLYLGYTFKNLFFKILVLYIYIEREIYLYYIYVYIIDIYIYNVYIYMKFAISITF